MRPKCHICQAVVRESPYNYMDPKDYEKNVGFANGLICSRCVQLMVLLIEGDEEDETLNEMLGAE